MAKSLYFSKGQLEEYKKKDLYELADYCGLDVNKRTKKQEILDMLLEYFCLDEPEGVESGGVQSSVRVRRIKESQK